MPTGCVKRVVPKAGVSPSATVAALRASSGDSFVVVVVLVQAKRSASPNPAAKRLIMMEWPYREALNAAREHSDATVSAVETLSVAAAGDARLVWDRDAARFCVYREAELFAGVAFCVEIQADSQHQGFAVRQDSDVA